MTSKGQELLENLNRQVKHQSSPEIPPKTIPKPQRQGANGGKKKGKKEQPPLQVIPESTVHEQPTNKEPQFKSMLREEQSHEPPQCLVQILTKQIGEAISEGMSEVVESIVKQRQKNTYDSLTGEDDNYYIQAMYNNARKKNQSSMDLIMNAMGNRASKVEDQVEDGKITIVPEASINTKKQLEFIAKLDLARMIKIKEGQLRSKLEVFHQKIDNLEAAESWNGVNQDQARIESQLSRRLAESMDHNNYALDSQKTKIARNYVKHMNRQRKMYEKRKKQREGRYQEQEAEKESEMQEAMEMKDLAKRQEIIERIEQRRKRREEEEQEIEKKEKEVHDFLQQFHPKNPLFKQKQKQFREKVLKPEERLREEKLNQIRQNRRALSLNQIRNHEEQYISNLKTDRAKRQEEFKLILQSRKVEDSAKPLYKGAAHKRMDQMTKETQKRKQALMEASKLKAMRMRQYSDVIHDKHKPSIDEKKKGELAKFIENDMLRKNKAKKVYKQVVDEETKEVKLTWHYEPLPSRDHKSEGNKYFFHAKKMAKRRKEETQSEHHRHEESQLGASRQAPQSMPLIKKQEGQDHKLKDIWSARSKQLKEYADLQVVDAKNFEYVKHNIENLDKKAEQRESLLKQLHLPMDAHIENKGMLDQFYLQSIKQKIKLLD